MEKTDSKLFYGYVIVIIAALMNFIALGTHYSFSVFFKPLSADFGWSRALTSSASSLAWFVQGFVSIATGGLVDRFGPRKVITIGGFILGLGYILMSTVNDLWQLFIFYGVMVGAGIAGVAVPLLSIIVRWFIRRRSAMTGFVVAGMGAGTLVIPLVANWLIYSYSWRIAYLVLGSVVILVTAVGAQFLHRDPSQKGLVPLGAKEHEREVNIAGTSAKDALRTWQFWTIFVIFFCLGFSLFSVMVHIVPYATDLKIDPTTAAGILSTIGGVSVLAKIMFGNVGDRIGSRNVYLIGFSLMTASLVWLLLTKEILSLYVFAVFLGLAYGACSVSQSPTVAYIFGLRSHGQIFGGVNNGLTLGAAAGPFVAGYTFDVSNSYHVAFILAAVVAFIGVIAALILKPIRK